MAINSDAYNKQQLNVIVKVIGAMGDEAIANPKKHQMRWLNMCRKKSLMHQVKHKI
jgi:hypothetical protein